MIGSQPRSNLTVCSYCVRGSGGLGEGGWVKRLQAIDYFAFFTRLHCGDIFFIELVKVSGYAAKQLIAS